MLLKFQNIKELEEVLKIFEYLPVGGEKEELEKWVEEKIRNNELLKRKFGTGERIISFLLSNGYIKFGINFELKTTWEKTKMLDKDLKRISALREFKGTIQKWKEKVSKNK
jgi:hypothetical protein